MAKTASRVLRTGRLYFNGVNAYAVVGLQPDGSGRPFTVYGWNEITIVEWLYAIRPKPSASGSKFSMIGGLLSTSHVTEARSDYTILETIWTTRKSDGTTGYYYYNWISEVNKWAFVVRRFTADREFSVWINNVKKYSVTVPANETTILEQNPENVSNPAYYKRFVLGASTWFGDFMSVLYGEVRIYNRALSSYEISEIYTRGTVIKDGLVLYLPFHEGEGNIAHDVSGYGNHGTIYDAQWVVKKALRVLPKAG